jgi:preprotein translocase subunit SecY
LEIVLAGLGFLSHLPELKKRLLFTLALLSVYRLGVFVSTPGIDVSKLRELFDSERGGALLGMVNLFSGGALENFSIFSLGITPYISVSIIVQLLSFSFPALERLKKDGSEGRRKLTRLTRLGTIVLALIQGYGVAYGLESQGLVAPDAGGLFFRLSSAITLTAGTAFIMWLGEQITERGLGNGISIIIFAGIVARMPQVLISTFALARTGDISPFIILLAILFSLLTVFSIVYVESAQRKIPIHHPKKISSNPSQLSVTALNQIHTQYLPIKLNMAGVLPPIFASAILLIPSYLTAFLSEKSIASFFGKFFGIENSNYIAYYAYSLLFSLSSPAGLAYIIIFSLLIVLISYFIVPTIFNPDEVSDDLKKSGGFIPTIRPGAQTSSFLLAILNKITLWGSIYLILICLLPQFLFVQMGVNDFASVFGGTAVLIVVGVTMDTVSQIRSMLVNKSYEAFLKSSSNLNRTFSSNPFQKRKILRR